ncbi:MAG: lipocalin-like domain-containing protein [Bacteroidetes bacterium]|nr:lipocalin-like domain-containing protein [Bacteroidota bacterium]MBS1539103.1 lipocalin-like domain-containing protein [Bacteroidota bacterium]
MKTITAGILTALVIYSCSTKHPDAEINLEGTWKLLSSTLVQNNDTTLTDYTKDQSFIKVINKHHFAFLSHIFQQTPDRFSAGGGTYLLQGKIYTEHLEYCSAPEWEGHDFTFEVSIHNDTLVQNGVEKIASQNINRLTIEKYIKVP